MKKIILLGACALCTLGALAQQSVLKEADRAMKNKATLAKVVEIVKPAFTNPETQNLAQTYYIPGKAAFNEYDHLLGLKQFGKLPANGDKTMGTNLLQGYDYMMKALPLDSVPDAKGKIKTKYSKDIISVLAGHYTDFSNTAITLFNDLKDYKGAYRGFGIFLEMSDNPQLYKGIQVPGDTTLFEIAYNQALAAFQAEDLEAALKCFQNSKARGKTTKEIYDNIIYVATQLGDTTTIVETAKEAIPLYGAEDPNYIRYIINDLLSKKDYANAFKAINEAIVNDPDNVDYYLILGVIHENDGKRAEAKEAYKKALEVDSESALANFYFGKSLCEDAYEVNDKAPTNPAEIEAYFNTKIKPLFEQAAVYLEKSYKIDPENPDVLRYLENVYYNLKDEAKLEEVQRLK